MYAFLLKLLAVIAIFVVIQRTYPEESREFPLRGLPFFLIPTVTTNNWKAELTYLTFISLNALYNCYSWQRKI